MDSEEITGDGPRNNWNYQRKIVCLVRSYPKTSSIIDVGSAYPPILAEFPFIKSKTVISYYFVTYDESRSVMTEESGKDRWAEYNVSVIYGDFMKVENVHSDIVICSQVLEHIQDADKFLQKLLNTGKTIIVSVPYKWKNTNNQLDKKILRFVTNQKPKTNHHKHENIDEKTLFKWSNGVKPNNSYIISDGSGRWSKRIIQVYNRAVSGL